MNFNKFNEDNTFWSNQREIDKRNVLQDKIEKEKSTVIENITNNWTQELTDRFISPRVLFNLTLEELKGIYNEISIDEKPVEKQQDIQIQKTKYRQNIDKDALNTLEELKEKHLDNDAVIDIRFDFDDDGFIIVFDVVCDTDIQSVLEYNGCRLKYNKVCEIPQEETIVDDAPDDDVVVNTIENEVEYDTSNQTQSEIDLINKLSENIINEQRKNMFTL